MTKAFLWLLISLCMSGLNAQVSNSEYIDSLSQLLNKAKTQEEKYRVYNVITDRYDNATLSDSYNLYGPIK